MSLMVDGKILFEAIGGRDVIKKVHKVFYDKVYKHPWIGKYFLLIKQEVIEDQQTDFMSQSMGGPRNYLGKFPIPAHKHMFITEELFELREALLKEAMTEVGINPEHQDLWLKIDRAFKKGIVKTSPAECEKRYASDEILNFSNPNPSIIKKAA